MLKKEKTDEKQPIINRRQFSTNERQFFLNRFIGVALGRHSRHLFEITVEIAAVIVAYHFADLVNTVFRVFGKQTDCFTQTKFFAPRAEIHFVMVFHVLPEE